MSDSTTPTRELPVLNTEAERKRVTLMATLRLRAVIRNARRQRRAVAA